MEHKITNEQLEVIFRTLINYPAKEVLQAIDICRSIATLDESQENPNQGE